MYNPEAFSPATPTTTVNPIAEHCTLLRVAIPLLQERDRTFALSLVDAFTRYGSLSDKQLFWVKKLTERATQAQEVEQARVAASQAAALAVAPPAPAAGPVSTQLAPSFSKVMDLFARAKEHGLAWPRIRLVTAEGQKIILKQYGETHKYTGQLAVVDTKKYPGATFFGRISLDGTFTPSRNSKDDVVALLVKLGEDPAGLAKLQGQLTDQCMFCGLGLTTKESVAVGYGPICAGRYGLPWGDKVVETTVTLTVEKNEA